MDQEKNKLTKRMLPFLMKPFTLLVLTGVCILGEVMWVYLGILNGNQWECVALFVVGSLLGGIGGGRTAKMWDKYYAEAPSERVRIARTPMGRRNSLYILLALAVPMLMSFITTSQNSFLPALQSYIFGFICGMNVAIYRWARKLPDQ